MPREKMESRGTGFKNGNWTTDNMKAMFLGLKNADFNVYRNADFTNLYIDAYCCNEDNPPLFDLAKNQGTMISLTDAKWLSVQCLAGNRDCKKDQFRRDYRRYLLDEAGVEGPTAAEPDKPFEPKNMDITSEIDPDELQGLAVDYYKPHSAQQNNNGALQTEYSYEDDVDEEDEDLSLIHI